MRKLLLAGVLALFLVAVLACGAAEESEVSQPTEAAQAPTEVMESTEVAQAEPTEVMESTEAAQAEPTEVMEPPQK
jgi:hypothetical protein